MTPRVRSAVLWGGLATATLVVAAPPAGADGSDIVLASVTSQQAQVADAPAVTPSVSADGRFVVFSSAGAGLVPDDSNGAADVFVRDTIRGVTARVSVDCDGDQAIGGDSLRPTISADGRWVVYESAATNLVGGDLNGVADVFVHELPTGVVRRVSVGADGAQAVLGDSSEASISADGRFVAFASTAPNLVAGDLNGSTDVFVHDTAEQVTRLVSVDGQGRSTTGSSTSPRISAEGRSIAFVSTATTLVEGDGEGTDVFVRDLSSATTSRVSLGPDGTPLAGASDQPSISADGRRVAFRTVAAISALDVNGLADIAVRDRVAGTTVLASVDSVGAAADGSSGAPAISGSGRFVAFSSAATSLIPGDVNGVSDVFVHDIDAAATSLGSVASDGTLADADGVQPALSYSGRYLAWSSAAGLVAGNRNGIADIHLAEVLTPPGPPTEVTATEVTATPIVGASVVGT